MLVNNIGIWISYTSDCLVFFVETMCYTYNSIGTFLENKKEPSSRSSPAAFALCCGVLCYFMIKTYIFVEYCTITITR